MTNVELPIEAPQHEPFDVSARFITIQGRGGAKQYLPCQARVDWLRDDAPDSIVEQQHIEIKAEWALFKTTVTRIVNGEVKGRADGYGHEFAKDFPDYILKAATVSLGRALNALGYGGSDLDEGVAAGNLADSPVDRSAGRGRTNEVPIDFASTRGHRIAGDDGGGDRRVASLDQPVTVRQLKFIQAITREKGMTDDDVNGEVELVYGKASVAELNRRDASAFIDRLQARRDPVQDPTDGTAAPPDQPADVVVDDGEMPEDATTSAPKAPKGHSNRYAAVFARMAELKPDLPDPTREGIVSEIVYAAFSHKRKRDATDDQIGHVANWLSKQDETGLDIKVGVLSQLINARHGDELTLIGKQHAPLFAEDAFLTLAGRTQRDRVMAVAEQSAQANGEAARAELTLTERVQAKREGEPGADKWCQ